MDSITLQDLRTLIEAGSEPKVSLYVSQQGQYKASDENAMQLRHVLFQAESKLKEGGLEASVVNSLLKPAMDLVRDSQFWQAKGNQGLAMLMAPDLFRCWQLPFDCESTVDVGTEFRVAPLVRLLNWPLDIRLVALSATGVRYFRSTRDAIQELELPPGTPATIDQFEGGPDVGRAVRFQDSTGATGSKISVHGQTSFKDQVETRVEAYVRIIARNIGNSLQEETLPLVLFAARELHPIFNDAYPAKSLVEPGILASPAHLSPAEIHEQAVRLVDAAGIGELKLARERYQSAIETHQSSSELEEIVAAACEGRVDTLIAAYGERVWGRWDEALQRILLTTESHPVDLLDRAVRETLRHGGRVCVVPRSDVPQQAQSVAALRWMAPNREVSAAVAR